MRYIKISRCPDIVHQITLLPGNFPPLKRIIFDTQSNELFRGLELEQNYDQRGGLCQVGDGHLVVTTNPIDPFYLLYWKALGFSLPNLVVAGPFDSRYTLSELVTSKKEIQGRIKSFVGNSEARLEFFCIEESERKLSRTLRIPSHCNFDFSIQYSQKTCFKNLCNQIGVSTPKWFIEKDTDLFLAECKKRVIRGNRFLIKSNSGTGGLPCGGMFIIDSELTLEAAGERIRNSRNQYFFEEIVEKPTVVVSLHWEIDNHSRVNPIGVFQHYTSHFSYDGISYPAEIPTQTAKLLRTLLVDKVGPYIIDKGGYGFFHCDIIVDAKGNGYWIDFNPRKGGGLYIWDMVRRLSEIRLGAVNCFYWNEHVYVGENATPEGFSNICDKLSNLLAPGKKAFVVVTNPGVIPFGWVDLTGISIQSKQESRAIVAEAKARIL